MHGPAYLPVSIRNLLLVRHAVRIPLVPPSVFRWSWPANGAERRPSGNMNLSARCPVSCKALHFPLAVAIPIA